MMIPLRIPLVILTYLDGDAPPIQESLPLLSVGTRSFSVIKFTFGVLDDGVSQSSYINNGKEPKSPIKLL